MKVLFSALHFGTLRNFESVIEELSARGHEVLLQADEPENLGGQGLAEALSRLPAPSGSKTRHQGHHNRALSD